MRCNVEYTKLEQQQQQKREFRGLISKTTEFDNPIRPRGWVSVAELFPSRSGFIVYRESQGAGGINVIRRALGAIVNICPLSAHARSRYTHSRARRECVCELVLAQALNAPQPRATLCIRASRDPPTSACFITRCAPIRRMDASRACRYIYVWV